MIPPSCALESISESAIHAPFDYRPSTPVLALGTVLAVSQHRTYNPPIMSNKLPMERRTFLEMGSAAAIGHSLRAFGALAQAPNAAAVKVEKDVVVGKGGDVDLHCDIYSPPAGTEKRMALVHFHGGGFRGGSKDTLAAKVAPITARGYVSIAAQ